MRKTFLSGEGKMLSVELDQIDKNILELVQNDASLSVADIAEKVGLSSSPCWRRIKRMEEQGVIQRRVTVLDRNALGLNFEVVASVKLQLPNRENLEQFEKAIEGWPEVVECMTVTGAVDYIIRVLTLDMHAYDDFLRDKLMSLGLVSDVQSRIIVRVSKRTTAVPLSLVEDAPASGSK
jgi:DNA-binding Lrp family transcriptional regulator